MNHAGHCSEEGLKHLEHEILEALRHINKQLEDIAFSLKSGNSTSASGLKITLGTVIQK